MMRGGRQNVHLHERENRILKALAAYVDEYFLLSGRYNTSLGLYGIYSQGEAETNIAHTALDKLLYQT